MNGDKPITELEFTRALAKHNEQHHELDLKLTRMCNRIEKIEEKMLAAIQTAKWAIPLLLLLAGIIEHFVVSIVLNTPT